MEGERDGCSETGRVPTGEELVQLAKLRQAVAADAAAGRVRVLSMERAAKREEMQARRQALHRLLMQGAESPQRRLAD